MLFDSPVQIDLGGQTRPPRRLTIRLVRRCPPDIGIQADRTAGTTYTLLQCVRDGQAPSDMLELLLSPIDRTRGTTIDLVFHLAKVSGWRSVFGSEC